MGVGKGVGRKAKLKRSLPPLQRPAWKFASSLCEELTLVVLREGQGRVWTAHHTAEPLAHRDKGGGG